MSKKLSNDEIERLLARVNELGAAWGTTCSMVEMAISELRELRARHPTNEEVDALNGIIYVWSRRDANNMTSRERLALSSLLRLLDGGAPS